MDNCFLKLKELRDSLPTTERKIAEIILSNPSKISLLTISELAEYCQTSNATITRMCKSLGYKGYKEFIKCLILDLSNFFSKEEKIDYSEVTKEDSLSASIDKVINNNILAIKNNYQIIDLDDIRKTITLLQKARRIHFYGVGGSSIVALDAEFKFLRLAKDAHAFTSFHEQIFAAAGLNHEDVAVIISYSGETEEIIKVLSMIKKTGAKTIGITRYSNNTISRLVDISLKTTSIGNSIRSIPSGARIAQLNMIDILYTGLAVEEQENLKQYYDATNSLIDFSKKKER